jgi:phage N-6-adenine-methyltransferase
MAACWNIRRIRSGFVTHYTGARRQDWTTPRAMFDTLNDEYGFTLDGASGDGNALLPNAKTAADVFVSWEGERVFCNPPWSRIAEFVELAAFADLAVLLVPARVNTRWFHRALELGAQVRFFQGRPRFGDGKGSCPFDCLLLVFGS